ncbi:muts2 protein [Lasius niger]|uniref:Muts2 protein n=1 Tax=Lasius niger TaxID=67767 RepID=A0A0J7KNU2_LASNI|nr:muts2 protein [Lasius niger]
MASASMSPLMAMRFSGVNKTVTSEDPQKAKREAAKKIYQDAQEHVARAETIIEKALIDLKRLKEDPLDSKEAGSEELRKAITRDTEIIIGLMEAGREGYRQRCSQAEFNYRQAGGVIAPDGTLP